MYTLEIKAKGQVEQSVSLDPCQTYTLGRGEDSDIRLMPFKGISRHHLRLAFTNDLWTLEVLSTFGKVFCDGQVIQHLELSDATIFTLGPYEFRVMAQSVSPALLSANSAPPVNPELTRTMVAERSPLNAYIKVIDHQGYDVEVQALEGELWTAGRESSNHIVIRDSQVSRKQFRLYVKEGQFYILDLGSSNGTYVNGKPASSYEPLILHSGDEIKVLDHRMIFEVRDPLFHDRVDALNIHPAFDGNSALQVRESPSASTFLPDAVPQPHWQDSLPQEELQGEYLNFWGHKLEKTRKNFIRLGLLAAVFLAMIIYFASEDDQTPQPSAQGNFASPFDKLKHGDQDTVKHKLATAKELKLQGKFYQAQKELVDLHFILPEGYQGSKALLKELNDAVESDRLLKDQEKLVKDREENRVRIIAICEECKKTVLVKGSSTAADMEACLLPAIQVDPSDAQILELKDKAREKDSLRAVDKAKAEDYREKVAQLRSKYSKALSVGASEPLKMISQLEGVIRSNLPDPDGLRNSAREKVNELRMTINTKVRAAIAQARQMNEAGKSKEAAILLERSLELDPQNGEIKKQHDFITTEIRKKMQMLYQEAIVEENLGNLETAKDRWKKILEGDVPQGDYFQKAKVKLKKYGIF